MKEGKPMNTQVLPANDDSLRLGAQLLQAGQLVAFPTETVYGLGANALEKDAVLSILRPRDGRQIIR